MYANNEQDQSMKGDYGQEPPKDAQFRKISINKIKFSQAAAGAAKPESPKMKINFNATQKLRTNSFFE